jgi:hypothetical protein
VTEPAEPIQLLLDEMFAPRIAEALRERKHNVIALVERPDMRAMPDEEVFAWAAVQRCWLLTENVKEFQPITLRALPANASTAGLLLTSRRTFPALSPVHRPAGRRARRLAGARSARTPDH